ncbi:MAG: Flp pilus assembly complex ATPase component TadA [Acidisphaera sp.]|nr:Flp pilus assembly complex ATPase component TadA [Acidisphaera sp.]
MAAEPASAGELPSPVVALDVIQALGDAARRVNAGQAGRTGVPLRAPPQEDDTAEGAEATLAVTAYAPLAAPLPEADRSDAARAVPAPELPAPTGTREPSLPAPPARRSGFLGGIAAELVSAGLLTERRAVALGFQARETGETLLRVLAREAQAADLEPVYEFLARRCGQALIRQKNELIERVAEAPWLPIAAAEQRGILLLRAEAAGEARYAAIDPCDLLTRDWVGRRSGATPVPVPVLPDVLLETIGRLRTRSEMREADKPLVPIDINWEQEQQIREKPERCDVPTLVDFIVHTAYEQGASDIHIEPVEDGTVVRGRIDGILHEECRMPLSLHPAITSRIKVLAGMDVAERRRPQDGRITAQIRRMPLDIRVSSSPTVLGEKIVMRLLDEKALRPAPEQLGLRDNLLRLLLDKIAAPHGLVMLSGPTGSGKTTTLYSCLSALDRQRRNILTIEDPVEYRLKGVHQMQVNERIGLTFATGLRNILRQDPDVIMVGECRDVETAKMAIQASLTGHVVFSTIHANDAVGVISRLLDMQIDPYLVATALSLPIGQRLVRAICPRCRTTVDGGEMLAMLHADGVSNEKLARLGLHIDPREPCHIAPGCPNCRHTGYAGRQAVFEMFEITEPMRDLIASADFSADALRRLVAESGATSMVENALALVEEGLTTHAEIVRVFGDGAS